MPTSLIAAEPVAQRILLNRGQKVMLDADLAEIYGAPTKRFNEQVKRNLDRFPADFMFQLTEDEYGSLRPQFVTLKTGRGQHRKYLPYAFTADIELNPTNPIARHSGEGRNPARTNTPRSGQNRDVVPLSRKVFNQLDSGLRRNDKVLANGLFRLNPANPFGVKKPMRGNADKKQRGFSLISAIFLLVVIAALGTFAVTLSTTQQQSSALDVQGARAYQAARAGIEWGAYQVLRNNSCVATTTLAALPNTLAGFTVTVTCTSSGPITEAGTTVTIYQLTSTATQGTAATPSYVERQMTVTIAK